MRSFAPFLVAAAALATPFGAAAEARTVCTITVNSADEKETFRERLPKGRYRFVELVEKGRPDWLRSACRRNVQCDVLVVSGHFNAGDTFYSDRLENHEYLEIDELERAACSASCPNLFARLKEVYLFGCESLNPDASRYASSYGESGRERMRRIFAGVPVIYGFSSSAPVGPTAAMLLRRYFQGAPAGEIGAGRPSARMLRVFGRNSMTHVAGVSRSEPMRAQVCGFFDEGRSPAQKLAHVHAILRGEAGDPAGYFKRIERLMDSFSEAERADAAFRKALARISTDRATRGTYLAVLRRTSPYGMRARLIDLAATLGWLDEEQHRLERVALVNDVLAAPSMGYAEVDLVCGLNKEGDLDGHAREVRVPAARATRTSHAAAMACLGDDAARGRVLHALASGDEKDAQAAQVYLRHRPVAESAELRNLARRITRMPDAAPGQVRALDALARLNIADREILQELSRAFAETRSAAVQRALAEVFIRSDPRALPRSELLGTLREHRLRKDDLVDALIRKLEG